MGSAQHNAKAWRVSAQPRQGRLSMAGAAARIRCRLARHRHELPRVRAVTAGELEHAVHVADPRLAVGNDEGVRKIKAVPTRSHDDLADSVDGVRYTR